MKLDRNINTDGRGKYRLWDERKQAWVDDCGPGQEHEYFVVMLKDRHAAVTLCAYAYSVAAGSVNNDTEWRDEVLELMHRAGPNSPFCQDPD
jgi:hypothetical protein